jgi:hypothetical protein
VAPSGTVVRMRDPGDRRPPSPAQVDIGDERQRRSQDSHRCINRWNETGY